LFYLRSRREGHGHYRRRVVIGPSSVRRLRADRERHQGGNRKQTAELASPPQGLQRLARGLLCRLNMYSSKLYRTGDPVSSNFVVAAASSGQMVACDPRFRTLLERVGARPFDESRDCVYGVWRDLTLSYCNAAWAEKVGVGPEQESFLGRPILDVCRPERRSFFARALTKALQRGEVWERTHATPCAEPERRYLMRLLPLAGDGLLAWHAPVAEGEYGDLHGPLFAQAACRTPAGLIIQSATAGASGP